MEGEISENIEGLDGRRALEEKHDPEKRYHFTEPIGSVSPDRV
jgi:hypothetical protein